MPPEFVGLAGQVASLRSELRTLRGALEVQRPRIIEADRVVREANAIRSDLRALGNSLDSRRTRLRALRSSQDTMDDLAETVAAAARETSETLRRDREQREASASATFSLPLHSPALSLPPQDRNAMLRAARERMRRRGVSNMGASGASVGRGLLERPEGSMFDRIRYMQDASERAARAVLDSVQGAPIVKEVTLTRSLADDACSICLEPRKRGQVVWVLDCGHTFHKCCAQRWLEGACTCPLCKASVQRHKRPEISRAIPPTVAEAAGAPAASVEPAARVRRP